MFNFIKKIKEKRLAEAKAKREAYQARKAMIDEWKHSYWRQGYNSVTDRYYRDKEYAEKKNSVCPKCKSTDVVNHIRRNKGELHGKGNISGGFGLFGGYVSGSSKVDGSLDTLPVNKCNTCGHEWYVEIPKQGEVPDEFSTYSSYHPQELYDCVKNYLNLKFNPNDLNETCNSLEEKRQKYIDTNSNRFTFDLYRTVPKYMLDYAMWKGMKKRDDDWIPSIFGYRTCYDEYSYEMPLKLWELVKMLIGWKER